MSTFSYLLCHPPSAIALPRGGAYTNSQSIILTSNKPGPIYYTKDGRNPTTASQQYSGAITVSSNGALKYFTIDAAGNKGNVQTEIYYIEHPAIPGACGGNNGKVLATAPTTSLCDTGSPSASGVWNWNCVGQNGGETAGCSATFGYQVSVTIAGTGSGNVTSDAVATGVPSDISCNTGNTGTCSAGYPNADVVTLTATPGTTSTFTNWSGACTSTPCSVTMNAPKAVTATFATADRARIVGGLGYSTLAAAYLEAAKSATATIKTLDTTLTENLTLDKPVAIILQGGWNTTFTGKSGLPTVLDGLLTIRNGKLTVDRLIIK